MFEFRSLILMFICMVNTIETSFLCLINCFLTILSSFLSLVILMRVQVKSVIAINVHIIVKM